MFSLRMKLLQYLQRGTDADVTLKREYRENCVFLKVKEDKKNDEEDTKLVWKEMGMAIERMREGMVRI